MKIPGFNATVGEQLTSKGFIGGWAFFMLGVFVVVSAVFVDETINTTATQIGVGICSAALSMLGLRDKK